MELKFKSESERKIVQEEAAKLGITLEEYFLKRRKLEIGLTDWERRLAQKQNWREKRHRYMRAIRRFHDSTRGKEFHKKLARFLATRDTSSKLAYYQSALDKEKFFESIDFNSLDEKRELLIAFSSLLTHALIEERYYAPLQESVDYKLFLATVIVETLDTFYKLVTGKDEEVDWEFWCDLFRGEVNEGSEKTDEAIAT